MNITKKQEDQTLTLALDGRLDSLTAPQLEAQLKDSLTGIEALRLDFSNLEYLSSAGLRVLLSAQKTMMKQGTMAIFGTNEGIDEILELTGLSQVFTIEKDG